MFFGARVKSLAGAKVDHILPGKKRTIIEVLGLQVIDLFDVGSQMLVAQ